MKCEDLTLAQLPALAQYIIPKNKEDDSVLETHLNGLRDGYMALGILLNNDHLGQGDDSEDCRLLMTGMSALAYVYRELDRIEKEVMKFYFQMR